MVTALRDCVLLTLALCAAPLAAQMYSPPRTWRAPATGEGVANPLTLPDGGTWRLDQIWPPEPLNPTAHAPLIWTEGNQWSAAAHSFGGQPTARLERATLVLAARSAWSGGGDAGGQKLPSIVFVAPAKGAYRLVGQANAHVWQGKGPVRLLVLRRTTTNVTEIASLDLPDRQAMPLDLGAVSLDLEQGQELVLVPTFANKHCAANIQITRLAVATGRPAAVATAPATSASSVTPATAPAGAIVSPQQVHFPADAGVLNVRDFGAVGDGVVDDTAAIQRALSEALDTHRIVYLPEGVYSVSDTLRWWKPSPREHPTGGWGAFAQLQGQSQARTVIRLRDSAEGFGDPAKPKAVVQTGSRMTHGNKKYQNGEGNEAFENHIRNLTIDTGRGNPGAVALDWQASNCGAIRQLTLRSNDPKQPAAVGLSLLRRDNGPGLAQHVTIEGFRVGIHAAQSICQMVLEHVTLVNQAQVGILVDSANLAMRSVDARGKATLARITGKALFTLLDARAQSPGSDGAAVAVEAEEASVVISGLGASGYRAVLERGPLVIPGAGLKFWVSEAPLVLDRATDHSFRLGVRETPEPPEDDVSRWVGPGRASGQDDTAAIQKAMDSGARTIYLCGGEPYRIASPIRVPPGVRRIVGCGAQIGPVSRQYDQPIFILEGGRADDLTLIDRLTVSVRNGCLVSHHDARTVVLRDLMAWTGSGRVYRNGKGSGPLFVEDVAGASYELADGSQVWARQLNIEGARKQAKLTANGTQAWILGFKHEGEDPVFRLSGNSRVEALGGLLYTFGNIPADRPAFEVDRTSSLTLSLVGATYVRNGFFGTLVSVSEAGGGAVIGSNQAFGRDMGIALPMLFVHPDP